MDTNKSEHGWRDLRSGEVIRTGDKTPGGFGGYTDVPAFLVGKKVIAGDCVLRARKRATQKSGQVKFSARTSCVSNVNTSENDRLAKSRLV